MIREATDHSTVGGLEPSTWWVWPGAVHMMGGGPMGRSLTEYILHQEGRYPNGEGNSCEEQIGCDII